ncbi:MAG TPA: HEAT repeat domain-containing protein [Kineosporiaceae bacterium]|nr:HEAT repeat domain-containing protein [Kineosporiaceae bacterium]
MGAERDLSRLVALLPGETDEDWDVDDGLQQRITELEAALARCGDLTIVPAVEAHLDAFLTRGETFGRDVLAEVLAGLAEIDALGTLLRASARSPHDDRDGLHATVLGLVGHHPAAARAVVLELVETRDDALRAVAVWLLDFVVHEDDAPLLLAAARDASAGVRSAAAAPLGQLAGQVPAATAALLELLDDTDAQVRVSSLNALGHLDGDVGGTVVAQVAAHRDDPDPRVREWVAIATDRLRRRAGALDDQQARSDDGQEEARVRR